MLWWLLSGNYAMAQEFTCGNEQLAVGVPSTNVQPPPSCYGTFISQGTNINNYKPAPQDPIKRLRVKLHVMQLSSFDPQNFQDIPAHREYLIRVINRANENLSNLVAPLYGSPIPIPYPNGSPHVSDARFQLVLDPDDIFFHVDAVGWNNNDNACGSYVYSEYGIKDDCALDIFILGETRYSGCAPDPYFHTHVNFFKDYEQYLATAGDCCFSDISHARNVIHELGHNLGLKHSFEFQSPQAISDIQCTHCSAGLRTTECGNACSTHCDPISAPLCYNNIMGYTQIRKNNLTPQQVAVFHARMFTSTSSEFLVVDYDPSTSFAITGTEQWDLARLITGDVIIEPGARLTITCKVIMAPDATFQIKPGGKLVVDGGHLTISSPNCGSLWGGILVGGNAGLSQTPSNQGVLELKNNALVEYANTAASVLPGGYVLADNSTIKNCRYGFYFWPYLYSVTTSSTVITLGNRSKIDDCDFLVDNLYPEGDLYASITLRGIHRLAISDSHFRDVRTGTGLNDYLRASGIASLNSSFSVTNGVFKNLYLGIEAGQAGSVLSYTVRNSVFEQCYAGIISRDISYFSIRDNSFMLGAYNRTVPPTEWDGVGVSIETGTGFKLENNSLQGTLLKNTLGIVVNQTGAAANEITNNTFHQLTFSNYAQGINALNVEGGLQYICNANTLTDRYDFYVRNGGRIAEQQGSVSLAAGNTFTNLTGTADVPDGRNFRNAPDALSLQYHYFDNDMTAPRQNPGNVVNTQKIEAQLNSCELDEEDDDVPPEKEPDLESDFSQQLTLYLSAKQQYEAAVVVGVTTSGDTAKLRSSYAAMQALGRKRILNTLLDSAGAHHTRLHDQLTDQHDFASLRLRAELYWQAGQSLQAQQWLQDSVASQAPTEPLAAADFVTYQGIKTLQAQVVAQGRDWSDLLPAEQALLVDYADQDTFGSAGAQARQILNVAYGYNYLNLPPFPDEPAQALRSENAITPAPAISNEQRSTKELQLTATPNPAHGQVLFSYHLNDQIGGGYHLVVSDLWGRTVYTVPLSGATSGQHTWYPHQTPAGVYLYRLTQRGQTVVTPQRISILAH